jgi:hypothetical protein
MKTVLTALLLAASVTTASAQLNAETAGALNVACHSRSHQGTCAGYIMGIYAAVVDHNEPQICVPDSVNDNAIVDQVASRLTLSLARHPDWKNDDAAATVILIISSAYQCK